MTRARPDPAPAGAFFSAATTRTPGPRSQLVPPRREAPTRHHSSRSLARYATDPPPRVGTAGPEGAFAARQGADAPLSAAAPAAAAPGSGIAAVGAAAGRLFRFALAPAPAVISSA